MRQHEEYEGLFPLTYSMSDGQPQGPKFSVGARADSAYEYLLKQWLMTGKTEQKFLDMCTSRLLLGTETDIASGSGRARSDELLRVRSRCESDRDLMGIEREAEDIEMGLLPE